MKKLAILGSTGSIGVNTLLIVERNPHLFKVIALSAHKNVKVMTQQCELFSPEWASLKNIKAAKELKIQLKIRNIKTQVLSGSSAACKFASLESVDYVVSAIVGSAGLMSTLHAVKSRKTVLLANKESLVIGNSILMREVVNNNAILLPIDSEHSAIFQSLPIDVQKRLGLVKLSEYGIKSMILTGSGGPFLNFPLHKLNNVTPRQACAHPTWRMGKKISVDSATMMNKGLEYIEAKLLFHAFDIKIELVIHPQSIIHSMVRYCDGNIIANLSINDIKLSISYAMFWPDRVVSGLPHLDFSKVKTLSFLEPDFKKYPCLKLALNAFLSGHASTIILNAANEVAVSAFLCSKIKFNDIYKIIDSTLNLLSFSNPKTFNEILEIDKITRMRTQKILSNFVDKI
ncbi:MAG: 1-deoxy-D-xylulose-5-phosphate reductoisomerase [Buchnera aphidicola (Meitanaphis flavogallis)]